MGGAHTSLESCVYLQGYSNRATRSPLRSVKERAFQMKITNSEKISYDYYRPKGKFLRALLPSICAAYNGEYTRSKKDLEDVMRMLLDQTTPGFVRGIYVSLFPADSDSKDKAPFEADVTILCNDSLGGLMEGERIRDSHSFENCWYQKWYGDQDFRLPQTLSLLPLGTADSHL